MKIKHWQGYGCVNAKKTYDSGRLVSVEVVGNHEWGLIREYDNYTIEKWLGRFFKDRKLDHYIIEDTGYKKVNGIDTEYARYTMFVKEA